MDYRPGTFAKLSTLIAALGWIIQLWFASRRGANLAQGAFLNILGAFLLVVVPMIVGTICFHVGRRSQRAGDIGFSVIMMLQGALLAGVGAMAG